MDAITWARDVGVLLHLIGFAALLGGALVQLRESDPVVNGAMVFGAVTELVTGLGLVGLDLAAGAQPVLAPLVTKLVITLVLTLLVLVNRRFDSIPKGLWAMLTLLTLVNAVVAVLW